MADLSTTYMGLKLKNPVIAGSSGKTQSKDEIKKLADAGIGAVVLKSVFEEQIRIETDKMIKNRDEKIKVFGDAFDKVLSEKDDVYSYQEALGYITNFAAEHTLEEYLKNISEIKKSVNIPVIASVNCVSHYQWNYFARRIQEAGADAIELNVFILPTDFNRSGADNEKLYTEIYKEVKRYTTLPVSLKMGYYFSGLAKSVQEISKCGVSGLVLFNRPFHPDIDIDKIEISTGKILSDESEYHNTLRWIAMLSGRVGCSLSAATGIHDSESAIKMLLAGADSVQVTSAIYKNGDAAVKSIIDGIEKWMSKKGFSSISDFKGKLSHKNLENPAAYERVQFMKYYAGIE